MIYELGEAHIHCIYGRLLKPRVHSRVDCVKKAMHTQLHSNMLSQTHYHIYTSHNIIQWHGCVPFYT